MLFLVPIFESDLRGILCHIVPIQASNDREISAGVNSLLCCCSSFCQNIQVSLIITRTEYK